MESPSDRTEPVSSLAASKDEKVTVTSQPKDGQIVYDGETQYTTVKEGLAYILTPPGQPTFLDPKAAKDGTLQASSVFYNPIQQFNRDLSVLAIRAFGEELVEARKLAFEAKKCRSKRNKNRGDPLRIEEGSKAQEPHQDSTDRAEDELAVKKRKRDDAEEVDIERSAKKLKAEDNGQAAAPAAVETSLGQSAPRDHEAERPDDPATKEETHKHASSDSSRSIYKPSFRILDALSATGLRAIRYANELSFATKITANDLSSKATALINLNIQHNDLQSRVKTETGNANAHMYNCVGQEGRGGPAYKYDVIDLDPYGTAVPFLDAAVQALSDGGLLCVTCTDAGVFASTGYPEKTYSQYGGLPFKGPASHEAGLRLIVHSIATSAAKYGLSVEPLLSLSIDYYARVFVRVRKSPAEVKFLAGKTMMVYACDSGCGSWKTQFLARNTLCQGKREGSTFWKHSQAQAPTVDKFCAHCGFKTHLAGPMYGGPLHNPAFIERILSYLPSLDSSVYGTIDRIEGMLQTAWEEILDHQTDPKETPANGSMLAAETATPPVATNARASTNPYAITRVDSAAIDHHPFFFIPSALAKVLHCTAPSEAQVKGALRHAGYRATRGHTRPGSVKTDAPWSVVWDIMKQWVRDHAPIKEGAVKKGAPGYGIMYERKQETGSETVITSDQAKPAAEGDRTKDTRKEDSAAEVAAQDDAPNGEKQNGSATKPFKAVFDAKLGKDKESKRLKRYQLNPRPNWGPMARAK